MGNFIKVFLICCFTQITYITAKPSCDDLAKVPCPAGHSKCYPFGTCCKNDEEICSDISNTCESIFKPGQNQTKVCCDILNSEDKIENGILTVCLNLLGSISWKEYCNNARSSPATKSCPPEYISCYNDTCCDPSLQICSNQSKSCVPVFRDGENKHKLCCEAMIIVDIERDGLLEVCSHSFRHWKSGCQVYSRPEQVLTNPDRDDSTWKIVANVFIVITVCSLFFCIGRFWKTVWNKCYPKREIRANKSEASTPEKEKLLKQNCDRGTETSPELAGLPASIPPATVAIALPEDSAVDALYTQGNESTNKQMHDDKFKNAMKTNSSSLASRDPTSAQFINNNNHPNINTHGISHNVRVGNSTDTQFQNVNYGDCTNNISITSQIGESTGTQSDNVKDGEGRFDISLTTPRRKSKATEFHNEKHGDYRYGTCGTSSQRREPTVIEFLNPMHGDSTNAINSDLQGVLTGVQLHNVKHRRSTNDTSDIALQEESAENREDASLVVPFYRSISSSSQENSKGQENDMDIAK